MDRHELAWAAGFFDGEGWANRDRTRRRSHGSISRTSWHARGARLSSSGSSVSDASGARKSRRASKTLLVGSDVARRTSHSVADLLGPWLCHVSALSSSGARAVVAPAIWPGSASEELAWAGGFFDGEGSTYLQKHRTHVDTSFRGFTSLNRPKVASLRPSQIRSPRLAISEASRETTRARESTGPYRRWRVFTPADVLLGLHMCGRSSAR